MKKRLIATMLVLMFMMSFTSMAAYTQQEKTADALNELGLFRGKGAAGYDLEDNLTRAEGATLLVRVLGKDAEAANWTAAIPFKDVPLWAIGYVGYAYQNGITNGTNMEKGEFSPNAELSDFMFLTLVLRALGYTDQGAQPQFVWNDPYALAKQVGLIDSTAADSDFTRGDAVEILWNAMGIRLVGKNVILAQSLVDQDVFSASLFKTAQTIQKNGRKENAGVPDPERDPSNSGSSNSGNTGNTGNTDNSGNTNTGSDEMTYEKYSAMSGAEQQAYFNTFKDPAKFFEWYNAAKAEYEQNQNRIEIDGNGSIDLGDLIGKN